MTKKSESFRDFALESGTQSSGQKHETIKAVIGGTMDWNIMSGIPYPNKVQFVLPLMPPSVNAYVRHGMATNKRTGEISNFHGKSPAAKAFIRDFGTLAPRDFYVVSQSGRFAVTLEYWPAAGGSGDVDNYNKLPLDCCAKAWMFRDKKGECCSDAWVKRLTVVIHDSPEDRKTGPRMQITIEAL